jgi:hypothetical protein
MSELEHFVRDMELVRKTYLERVELAKRLLPPSGGAS